MDNPYFRNRGKKVRAELFYWALLWIALAIVFAISVLS